ncbi:fimbrillin family protein [Paraprevotella clara]|uniref:fimbrillin family protein n=1 Tax=Paraprevotella clara TaxID=454154 RepID=UPI003FF0B538
MKQKFLYLAMAAMAMASCSQDETIDVYKGKGIGFRTETPAGTRALETTTANITEFWASAFLSEGGYQHFDPHTRFFKKDGFFTSYPEQQWPGDDKELTFYAISPEPKDLTGATLTLNTTAQKLENFTVANTFIAQQDLIYATATAKESDSEDGSVSLTFDHMLSQIEVKAMANDDCGYNFEVKGVRLGAIPSTSTLTNFTTKTWEAATTPVTYNEISNGVIILNSTAQSVMPQIEVNGSMVNDNAMLIPQQLVAWDRVSGDMKNEKKGAYIGVLVKITTKEGNVQIYPKKEGVTHGYACVPIDTKWEAGKHYVYTLDFSDGAGFVDPEKPDPDPTDPDKPGEEILGGGLKFKVTVTDWITPEDDSSLGIEKDF